MDEYQMPTPLGTLIIKGDALGVTSLNLTDMPVEPSTTTIPDTLKIAVVQINAYLKGERPLFDFLLNPSGTAFQKKVWEALRTIPYGTTLSYLELAIQLGDPKSIRAVAAANGKNPIWLVIPCHRVIGTDGSLTGYAGGLARKKWLLDFEMPPSQQSLF